MSVNCWVQFCIIVLLAPLLPGAEPISIKDKRELFADYYLIEQLERAKLKLQMPRDEGPVLHFSKPWEGGFSGYVTILAFDGKFRMYYRGLPVAGKDGSTNEVTCCADSADGIHWTKPELGLFEAEGTKLNNIVLAQTAPITHNFCPFVDAKPDTPIQQRFKAIGGTMNSGLIPWTSSDGLRWSKLSDIPILTVETVPYKYMFDSQNLAFWSESEQKYLCYFRVFQDGIRRIARSTSADFLNWTAPELMEYRHGSDAAPVEHLYTNQTHPYFRAPHLYVALAARFFPKRQVLSNEQALAIQVNPQYFKDTSDAIFMTTRGGAVYDRTFLEGFIRPGIGAQNWVSRTNYPVLNVIATSASEMSLYVNQDYAQPTAHVRRYSLRIDGFSSLSAGYEGGK